MDIWRWVGSTRRALRKAGHERLAELMGTLPGLVCDDEHGRVEAVVPEALALARAAREPWVEVFVRHWALQSRVLHRHEAREHLGEAVALLDFANRDETRGCPQSVCVTQDLTSCYAHADGPGYVEERLAVAAETLGRIDPSWPCYECISEEYASALQDAERHEEVLAWAQRQTDAAVEAGADDVPRFEITRVLSLLALSRPEEAWSIMEDHEADAAGGSNQEVDVDLVKARVLVALGRSDDAEQILPSFEVVSPTPSHYDDYAEAMVGLVDAGARPNDARLGQDFRRMLERAEGNGAMFLAARLAAFATRLALARGAYAVARACLDDADRFCAELRRPQPVERMLAEHRAAIGKGPGSPPELPATVDELLDALPDDAEPALEILGAAIERWPDDPSLAVVCSRALAVCRLTERAERSLRRFLERDPSAAPVLVELGRMLLREGRHDDLRRLVDESMPDGPSRPQALWFLALSDIDRGDQDAAIAHLEALLELDPEAHGPRHRLSTLLRDRGRHEEALAHLERLVAELDPGDHDWDRMTVAAIVGRWDLVRDSARRLELPLDGLDEEGPIDEPLGLCRLRYAGDDGPVEVLAERRSPVTARVVQMVGPTGTERFADLVAFDAESLDPPSDESSEDEDEDEDEQADDDQPRIPIHAVVHVLVEGGHRTWSLDGTHPGDEAWTALETALEELGGVVSVRNDERYQHVHPEDSDRMLPGVYAWACMPGSLEPTELHARLTELSERWEHPVIWPEIAAALPTGPERDRELARVDAVTDRYEL